jgi:hypothetical protein
VKLVKPAYKLWGQKGSSRVVSGLRLIRNSPQKVTTMTLQGAPPSLVCCLIGVPLSFFCRRRGNLRVTDSTERRGSESVEWNRSNFQTESGNLPWPEKSVRSLPWSGEGDW